MIAGCNRDNGANESAGAQKDAVKANADAQKDALNAQKDAVAKQASQQKDQIDAQAKAEKSQIEAKKDEVDAQAKAAKAQADANAKIANANSKAADAQGRAVNESAGAATAGATTTSTDAGNSDSLIKAKVRAAILGNSADASNPASVSANPNAPQNLNVDISNGKVTLKGTVTSDQAKMDCEQRAKQVAGVTAVDNQLEVKAQ